MKRYCACGARIRNTNPRVTKCELCFLEQHAIEPPKNPDATFHRQEEDYRDTAGFIGHWSSGYRRKTHEVTQ
jgi:hypothetical protein